MPHDPAKVAECCAWLDRAGADLDAADILLTAPRPRRDMALFHCQQAVEKTWKSFLFWHDVAFHKTHDLRALGEASARADVSIGSLSRRAEDLTPFAWLFRYPGESGEPTSEEAEAALALAREVYDSVLARLPKEAQP